MLDLLRYQHIHCKNSPYAPYYTLYWTPWKEQHLFAHVDELISAAKSPKADVYINYPQDLVADTALGYTQHSRWPSSRKSISSNGFHQSRQDTLPVSQIQALHNASTLRFPHVGVCLHSCSTLMVYSSGCLNTS